MARLKDRYNEEIAPALKDRFGIENPMQIPRLEKVVVNMGVGEAVVNSRALDGAMADLAKITGQKPQLRRARKSIAGFKIREGMPVGARVTRKALLVKQQKKQKFEVREYNRCQRCGRAHGYYRKFGLCRICLRELAHEGKVPGVMKASW